MIQGTFVIMNFKCKDWDVTGKFKNQEIIGSMLGLNFYPQDWVFQVTKCSSIAKELFLEFVYFKTEISHWWFVKI